LKPRKQGFRSTTTSREITVSQTPQTIQLQAPTPIYGIAEIESKPAMADIYIDGQKVGQTPQSVRNILVGDHVVVIKKDGYADYTSSLSVKENQTIKHLAILDESNGDMTSMVKKALVNTQSEIPSNPLNKSFKVRYNGVTFKCKAKRGFVTITGFDTNAAIVTIPAKVNYADDDYPVKEIDTFINGNNYSARKLIIEEGVEAISNFAFMEFRKLIDVTIPHSMKTIGKNAFRDNDGIKFNLPSKHQ
jgi:PEGA domain.